MNIEADTRPPSTAAASVGAMAGLRFLSELALLAALAIIGADAADGWRGVALSIVFPAAAAGLWGRFVAPKSKHLLPDPARAALEGLIFVAAGAGLWLVGHTAWALALAAVAGFSAAGVRRHS